MNPQRSLHQILLQPTDVLFFRDGRPMEGSLAGHAAAWPLPDVVNHAFHAALHRAGLSSVHLHRSGRSGKYAGHRERKFGSLQTAGPFPVRVAGSSDAKPSGELQWFFPRPKDAQQTGTVAITLRPAEGGWQQTSSLPKPLAYAVANTRPPGKDTGGEPWLSADAYQAYLRDPFPSSGAWDPSGLLHDSALADTEYVVGIAIDPETQTTGHGQAAGKIYAAQYLRLREGYRLGVLAEAMDKLDGSSTEKQDLILRLLNEHPCTILVGGQQRACTAQRSPAPIPLPLPRGLLQPTEFHRLPNGCYAVKWILLTPALWPRIPAHSNKRIQEHPGGWLPNWICPEYGRVLLKAGDTERQPGECRDKWRERVRELQPISARLVAAIVPKPIPVTGWALPNEVDRPDGGAKSTHLAVPAGAVYYFEAGSPEAAGQLAEALNWHGADSTYATIRNRRSTLLGEKGYGLGVCGTWQFYSGPVSDPREVAGQRP